MPDAVTSIGEKAFQDSGLTEITIPAGVTSISSSTFNGCSDLTDVTIPEGVTAIGRFAFKNSGLQNISLPNSITSVGGYAFDGCESLNYKYENNAGYLGNAENKYLVLWLASKGSSNVQINENTKIIADCAFMGCTDMSSITIPGSVTNIGAQAFYNTGLTRVEIPDGITTIEHSTFTNCRVLTSVTLPDSLTSIEHDAFNGCRMLTHINIPAKVSSIGEHTFLSCENLTEITIPASVKTVGAGLFLYCNKLQTIRCGAKSKPSGWDSNWKKDCSAVITWANEF